VTRQSDTSYLRFRGVTKWLTQACTIPDSKQVQLSISGHLTGADPAAIAMIVERDFFPNHCMPTKERPGGSRGLSTIVWKGGVPANIC